MFSQLTSRITVMAAAGDKPTVPAAEAESEDGPNKWGYDLYPERRGEQSKPKWWQTAFFGDGASLVEKTHCERSVYNCFLNSAVQVRKKPRQSTSRSYANEEPPASRCVSLA